MNIFGLKVADTPIPVLGDGFFEAKVTEDSYEVNNVGEPKKNLGPELMKDPEFNTKTNFLIYHTNLDIVGGQFTFYQGSGSLGVMIPAAPDGFPTFVSLEPGKTYRVEVDIDHITTPSKGFYVEHHWDDPPIFDTAIHGGGPGKIVTYHTPTSSADLIFKVRSGLISETGAVNSFSVRELLEAYTGVFTAEAES